MNRPGTTRTALVMAFLLVGTTLFSAPRAIAGDNYAFLVAVGDYDVKQLNPLAYARHDVLEFAKALTETGFKSENIVLMHDDLKTLKALRYLPQAEKIRKELELLLSSVDEGDAVIVAFAGHGVQFEGDDRNFFCPVDADLEDPKRQSLISLKEIYGKLEECQADRKLLLVDACRNDPLSKLARSREKVKLNSVTRPQIEPVPKGIVALFSCSAGQESYEWPDLEHGVFFHQILSGWKGAADTGDQELSLDELVAYTRKNTEAFARLKLGAIQTPQLKGEFNGTWVLRKLGTAHEFTNSIGMTLKLIPAGEFQMGSSPVDVDKAVRLVAGMKKEDADDEQPQHRVRISRAFYLGQHEVTVGQFRRFVLDDGYKTEAESDGKGGYGFDEVKGTSLQDPKFSWRNPGFTQTDVHPVVNVSWNDAQRFCGWLSGKEATTYRLPTEAEWEYAARAGTSTLYPSGDDPESVAKIGNIADGTAKGKFANWTTISARDGYTTTAPVGSFAANAFGVHAMIGNAWEWCEDVYLSKGYTARGSTTTDPKMTNGSEYRVLRGGSWFSNPASSRTARRLGNSPDNRSFVTGFRIVSVGVGVRTK